MSSVFTPAFWGALSVALALVAYIPYIRRTVSGTNKPHLFSWIIWTLLTVIACLIQITEGAGSGAWSGMVSSVFCIVIVLIAVRHGEKNITRSDWAVFLAALAAIPLWMMTQSAAVAAVWVTGIDALGYIPTMRKSWLKPYEEMVTTHALALLKHGFVLLAVENAMFSTTFYSWGMVTMNGLLVGLILLRRRQTTKKPE